MKRYLVYAMIAAAIGIVAFPASAGKGGSRTSGVITVADAVYGGDATAVVNPGGSGIHVLVKCYAPDLGGVGVYGGYFPADANNRATIGPLRSSIWSNSAATCTAEEGYFMRDGWGKWVTIASTTFRVSEAA